MAKNQFWHMRHLEPKRKFRWIATIGNGERIYKYVVQKVAKPDWTTTNKEHKILGHTFNFPGPVTWNTVDVTIIDLAGQEGDITKGNAALALQDAIYAAGYHYPTTIGAATIGVTKARAATALGGLKVDQLDATGLLLETYSFHNAFIEKVVFGGEFDYAADDFVDTTLTIRYDWAKIKAGQGQRTTDISDSVLKRNDSFNLAGEQAGAHRPKNSKGGAAY